MSVDGVRRRRPGQTSTFFRHAIVRRAPCDATLFLPPAFANFAAVFLLRVRMLLPISPRTAERSVREPSASPRRLFFSFDFFDDCRIDCRLLVFSRRRFSSSASVGADSLGIPSHRRLRKRTIPRLQTFFPPSPLLPRTPTTTRSAMRGYLLRALSKPTNVHQCSK